MTAINTFREDKSTASRIKSGVLLVAYDNPAGNRLEPDRRDALSHFTSCVSGSGWTWARRRRRSKIYRVAWLEESNSAQRRRRRRVINGMFAHSEQTQETGEREKEVMFSVDTLVLNSCSTVRVDSLPHRKWKEMKQQPSMLPGPAVPGCC